MGGEGKDLGYLSIALWKSQTSLTQTGLATAEINNEVGPILPRYLANLEIIDLGLWRPRDHHRWIYIEKLCRIDKISAPWLL